MNQRIPDLVNEISLMLVMTSAEDVPGLGMLGELCEDLAAEAAKDPSLSRLVEALRFVKSRFGTADYYPAIEGFVAAASRYVENAGTCVFPNEASPLPGGAGGTLEGGKESDLADSIDERFLAEFIETHRLGMEDFDAAILEFHQNETDPDEFSTVIKRYIHSLKGDAGAIGLNGISQVCHALEDLIGSNPPSTLVAQLLQFGGWVRACMQCYAKGEPPTQGAREFLLTLCKEPLAERPQFEAPDKTSSAVASPISRLPENESDVYTLTGEREILLEFAVEAEEHLIAVEDVILNSEGAFTADAIDTIFRGVHSIKGGSAYFRLEEMTKCSHVLENLLSEVRDGKRVFDDHLKALLLTYIDLQKNVLSRAKIAAAGSFEMKRELASVDFLVSLDAYCSRQSTSSSGPSSAESPADVSSGREDGNSSEEDSRESKADKLAVKQFVKVDTVRLDHLVDSIGEMVIYSSMLISHCREYLGHNQAVMDTTRRVEKFSRDLQDIGMSMRLVPIKGLFQKMSRLVWDTSKKLGKEIDFSMEGEDTELDRNLIDKLADPLMHMVRNSLDHGVEAPHDREAKGKERRGTVRLSASHSGGSIQIKVQDDGRGLDPEKLLAKAVEKGIVPAGQKLSNTECFDLIFAPGFSTAAAVTDISGRGVGMDVVRRNVESLRGRIHIESTVGKGSIFTIELPLTLAIIDGISVGVGSECFIIPSLSIVEFVRPIQEMISTVLDAGETLHFRGSYLPIFRLSDLYGIVPRYSDPLHATIVVVENNQELVAIMVDDVMGQCSTVIKRLAAVFEEGKGVAGCAIMPSGDVALILDIRTLTNVARESYRRAVQSTPKDRSGEDSASSC